MTDCTSLSTIAYQCCFIEGGSGPGSLAACYGVRAGSVDNMSQITIYPVVQLDVINCGDPPKNTIQMLIYVMTKHLQMPPNVEL